MEIFKLFGSILIDSDKADQSLQKTGKHTETMGSKLGKGLKTAVGFGIGLAAAGAAGAAALFGVATKSAEATDRIDKLSQKIGLSRKGFQEWDFIASQSGMSVEVLQSGFKTLSKQMDEASKGTKLSADYFKDLGVSITDNNGKMKTQEQMFNETVIALQGMEEGPKKAALANNILGKSATELAPLINGAAGSVEEMRKKANDLGLVLSDDAVDAGVKFTDSLDQVKRSLGTVGTSIGVSVMPIMQSMMEWITAHLPQIQKTFKVVFAAIGKFVKAASDIFMDVLLPGFKKVWNWISPYLPKIKAIFVSVFNSVKEAVMKAYNYLKPSFDNLVSTIKTSLMPIITGLWDTVKKAMPGIKAIFKIAFPIIVAVVKTVIDIIIEVIKSVKGIYDFIKPGLDLVATIFSKTFGGIVNIIEKAYNWLHKWNKEPAENKNIEVTTTRYNQSRGASQFAVGSRYIPYDMEATIHRGEMIVPRSENPYANSEGQIMPNSSKEINKQPISIQLVLQNGKAIAEFLVDDLDGLMGNKNKVTARSVGI